MTAEKPEGDVALLPCPKCGAVPGDNHWCAATDENLADAIACLRAYGWTYAADKFESQATRIATLSEALELIAEASYLDGACLIARRALSAGQGEAK